MSCAADSLSSASPASQPASSSLVPSLRKLLGFSCGFQQVLSCCVLAGAFRLTLVLVHLQMTRHTLSGGGGGRRLSQSRYLSLWAPPAIQISVSHSSDATRQQKTTASKSCKYMPYSAIVYVLSHIWFSRFCTCHTPVFGNRAAAAAAAAPTPPQCCRAVSSSHSF